MRWLFLLALASCQYNPSRAADIGDSGTGVIDAGDVDDDSAVSSDAPAGCAACGQFTLAATADSYLRAQFPDETHESDTFQRCGSGDPANCCTNRAIYQFDLAALPQGCVIELAELEVFVFQHDYIKSATLGVHRVTASWTEAEVTWNRRTQSAWTTAGGDFDPSPVSSIVIAADALGYVTWDITSLATEWLTGTRPNFGAIVVEPGDLTGVTQGRKRMRTRESSLLDERPRLAVTCGEGR